MNDQWIDQMREKMADYKWPAPEVSWDEIDQILTASKTRKARLLWLLRMAAAAAVFLLIVGLGYWSFLQNETEQMPLPTASVGNKPQPVGNHGDISSDPVLQPNVRSDSVVIAKSTHKFNMAGMSIDESETEIPIFPTNPNTINTVVVTEKEQTHAIEEKSEPADRSPIFYPADLHQSKHIDNRLTAKVYISSTMADSRQVESYSNQGGGSVFSYLKDSVYKRQTNYQPIRLGISIRYRFDDHWSLESGLSYTRLSSDITTTRNGVTTVTEQRLNYIGLPLSLSYNLWKSRRFGLYATMGGTIEKRLDASPWQFSLNGAAGAEYKLTNIFSLYAEPGIGYYFKDGSTTSTIYQDHPFNINLSFGLRFDLK
jgi:hypothetical protein